MGSPVRYTKETLGMKLRDYLLASDEFGFTSPAGQAGFWDINSSGIGVLYGPPVWLREVRGERRVHLGTIWFNWHGATPKRWLFRVNGLQLMDVAGKLAEELSSAFGVRIHVKINDERVRYETYMADYER